MSDKDIETPGDILSPLAQHLGSQPIAPAHGIAAMALTLAMKYHDINTVQDGTLYQQYKLEGRNLRPLDIDAVFETAIKIEAHLLASSERIARVVCEALTAGIGEETENEEAK